MRDNAGQALGYAILEEFDGLLRVAHHADAGSVAQRIQIARIVIAYSNACKYFKLKFNQLLKELCYVAKICLDILFIHMVLKPQAIYTGWVR